MFSPNGQLLYSSQFGGLGNDYVGGIVATDGRLYISGSTSSNVGFPLHCPNLPGYLPYCRDPSVFPGDFDGFIAQIQYDLTIGIPEGSSVDGSAALVFPNPANTAITVQLPATMQAENMAIYNGLGQQVISSAVPSRNALLLNIQNLPVGTYSVVLNGNGQVASGRFVKE